MGRSTCFFACSRLLRRGWGLLRPIRQDRRAITAMEYALVAGLVSLLIILSATSMGTHIRDVFALGGNTIGTAAP